jgi:hypothetical protein
MGIAWLGTSACDLVSQRLQRRNVLCGVLRPCKHWAAPIASQPVGEPIGVHHPHRDHRRRLLSAYCGALDLLTIVFESIGDACRLTRQYSKHDTKGSSLRFELFIAARYLRAKRRQAVIGVITTISVLGVAAGVASLIVALAITDGMKQDLQERLIGSTSHVSLMRVAGDGMKNWRPLLSRLRALPHVTGGSTGFLRAGTYLTGGTRCGRDNQGGRTRR